MAASVLPKPGSSASAPCKRCEHTDCRATRAMAQTACRLCDKPIGYETRFNSGWSGNLAHEACLLDALERNDARLGLF